VKYPNAFEKEHDTLLVKVEAAALKSLKEITEGVSGASTNEKELTRLEAAKVILSIRSDDA